MSTIFTRKLEERPVIELNHELQPVSEDKKIITELSSFLGAIARLYIPLDIISWIKVPEKTKEEWWKFVKVIKK